MSSSLHKPNKVSQFVCPGAIHHRNSHRTKVEGENTEGRTHTETQSGTTGVKCHREVKRVTETLHCLVTSVKLKIKCETGKLTAQTFICAV